MYFSGRQGAGLTPLAPNVPRSRGEQGFHGGALRAGPLAASLGDLGQAHPLPAGRFLLSLSFILRVQPATSFMVNVLDLGEMMGMGDAGCFFKNVMSFLGQVKH